MAYMDKKKKAAEDAKAALTELRRRIKEGDTQGVYIFSGDEEYMKRYYFSELKKSAGESINLLTMQGEVDFWQVCDFLSSVPMQEFSLFEVEEEPSPLRVLKLEGPDFSKLSEKDISELYTLFTDSADCCVIVIYTSEADTKTSKQNMAVMKKLSEDSLCCEFMRAAPGDRALLSWIKKHFDKAKIIADPDTVRYLCDSVGTDMCNLSNEIDKLSAYLYTAKRETLTKDDVDAVCIRTEEAITFKINDAILSGDFGGALEALSALRATRTEPILIFGAISKLAYDLAAANEMQSSGKSIPEINSATKLPEFVIRKYMSFLSKEKKDFARYFSKLLLEADEKLKSYTTDGYTVLENLLFNLIIAK